MVYYYHAHFYILYIVYTFNYLFNAHLIIFHHRSRLKTAGLYSNASAFALANANAAFAFALAFECPEVGAFAFALAFES